MANTALSTAEQNALSVKYDVLGTTVELDIDFVKKYLVRGSADLVTNQELVFFMNTCKMQKLNPLAGNEVYCIKYNKDEPAQLVVGKGAYMRRAYEHPEYICKEDGIIVQRGKDIIAKEGCCLYPSEILLGGWCRVHYMRNGQERMCYKEVALEEYDKGKASWKVKPATMINKVAVSQCVREAFPKDYEGLYSEEEMIASGAVPTSYQEVDRKTGEVIDIDTETGEQLISQDQRKEMFQYFHERFGGKDAGNNMLKRILDDMGIESTANITVGQLEEIEDLAEQKAIALGYYDEQTDGQ